jgi:hypothetical protein
MRWVPGLFFTGVKINHSLKLTLHLRLVPELRMSGTVCVCPLPQNVIMGNNKENVACRVDFTVSLFT